MLTYGFGVLEHPNSVSGTDPMDNELYYMQHPFGDGLNKLEGTGYHLSGHMADASYQWQNSDKIATFTDSQFIANFPVDNGQFLPPQPEPPPTDLRMSVLRCDGHLAQRRANHDANAFQQHAVHDYVDWSRQWSQVPESVSDTTSQLPPCPSNFSSSWPTPELEPTTLEEINSWLSLDTPYRSPSLMSSSSSSTAPSCHRRTPSSETIYQLTPPVSGQKEKPRCWDHGCNGRQFSTFGNLARHIKEKSDRRPRRKCPKCGALFSRTTARNQHVAKNACTRIRRYSNGRQRPDWTTRITDQGPASHDE